MTKKLGLTFFCFLTIFGVKSQGKSISLNLSWQSPRQYQISEDVAVNYLFFDGAHLDGGVQPVPYYSHTVSLPSGITEIEAELLNPVFVPMTSVEVILLDQALNPQIELKAGVAVRRFQKMGIVSFFPFQKDANGQWSKLVSADLQINYGRNPAFQLRGGSGTFATNSVLSQGSGDWYKVAVLNNGVHKITYEFLQSLGVDLTELPSAAINIYGNSFGMLPESFSVSRPDDLLKNAIYVNDGNDGVFEQGDYLLFYARGAHTWSYNSAGGYYQHTKNLYCDTSYYFININSANPQPSRVTAKANATGSVTHTVTTFDDNVFMENDAVNFVKSGREWFGDLFDFSTEATYSFNFPNIDVTQPVRVKADLAAKTPGSGSSSFTVTSPGTTGTMTITIAGVGTGSYVPAANQNSGVISFLPAGGTVDVKLVFNKFSSSSQGWINYLDLTARRHLTYNGNELEFRDHLSLGATNICDYRVTSSTSGLLIWEITNPVLPLQMNAAYNSGEYTFVQAGDSLREFIVFNPLQVSQVPLAVGKVEHQDLHASGVNDLIIVTHPDFLTEANDLAQLHNSEGTSTLVVTTTQVYNEFSSGMKDATAIRQFLKMFHTRAAGDPNLLPKYLLLFGDGSYDNKYRISGNTSFIPTYQSIPSTVITSAFVSDDYFVMLDDAENMNNSDQLDLAVGRIPVQTKDEAQDVVHKIITYSNNTGDVNASSTDCCGATSQNSLGDWRNMYLFIADDEDGNAYVNAAEEFADSLKLFHPFVNMDKVFLDAYLQQSTPGGERYPEASEAIKTSVERGVLVVNYIGHGGEVGWAHERILDVATINGWKNAPRFPLFMTATCEFSRFDDPSRTSAGEYVLLNPYGGGIGLLTTTRLVYSGPNEILNENFNRVVLQRVNGEARTLGDIFMLTKNLTITQIQTSNTRNFTLLGDPAVRLKRPKNTIVADSVNSVVIGTSTDTLKALSRITIKGHVEDYTGAMLSTYNGVLFPTVYDKEQTLYTLANDDNSAVRSFDLRKNVIYKGKATITNGQFTFSFVVPKDISYQFGPGKLSFYAHNGIDDANGYSFDITVGGTNPNAAADVEGPMVDLYLNDENFVFGGITDDSPNLIAVISDTNGVNTVGNGIGHDITAVLDGNTSSPYILNEYYTSNVNTYQSGVVNYPFADLAEGTHTLKFKIWDVYNNSSESYTEFVVAKTGTIALEHVLNYPNPFTTRTQFYFEHNQACSSIDVQIQVFTVSGKLVKTINEAVTATGYRIEPIEWDGTDDFGDRLAIGTYIYRVKIKTEDGKTLEKFEKLVILN